MLLEYWTIKNKANDKIDLMQSQKGHCETIIFFTIFILFFFNELYG